jgi:hypothetical protein
MLDLDAKQGGGQAQHKIARRTAPNGPEPDPARYAAALARAREIYGRVLDRYSPEWKARSASAAPHRRLGLSTIRMQ